MSDPAPPPVARKGGYASAQFILPGIVGIIFLVAWHLAVKFSGSDIFPTPMQVWAGLGELAKQGCCSNISWRRCSG